MSETQKTINAEAAFWVTKLQSPDCADADLEGLTQWIEASPAHAEAYAMAMVVWADRTEAEDDAPEAEATVVPFRRAIPAPSFTRRAPVYTGLMGMAAVLVAGFLFLPDMMAPSKHYETKIGGRQTLTLADGTDLSLNTNTKVAVSFTGQHRTLTLEQGEIAIDVGDGSEAPLTVVAGDVSIRDIGTRFNVSRLDGVVRVTVREGIVDMTPGSSATQRILAGQQGTFPQAPGQPGVKRIDPEPAFAWQTSRAIYQGTPLSDVVRDLNRYYEKPIVIDGNAGDLRLSAILALDSQAAVTKRLADFLPIDVLATDDAIHIRRRGRPSGDI